MNPVELDRGRAFKSLANYLLHDVEADTSERVGWVQSYNLAGADGDRSWRLMASTAMSAKSLKEAAGLRTSGGQNKKPVYHYTLTWPQDDNDRLDPDMQRKAVAESLKTLGFEEHQALAVEHTDLDHKHVHVVVNLINPVDGTTPKLSYTQKNLRKWANKFEEENDLTLTEGSRTNEQKRQNGEQVDARRKKRNIWEQEQREGNDKRSAWLRSQENGIKRNLSAEAREMRQLHNDEWQAAKVAWKDKKANLNDAREREIEQAIEGIKADFKPEWAKVFNENRDRMERFEKSERNVLSQAMNTAGAFFKARKQGDSVAESLLGAMNKKERRGFVEIENSERLDDVRKSLNARIKDAKTKIRREYDTKFKQAIDGYRVDCEALKERQQADRTAMKGKWREYNDRRKQTHEKLHGEQQAYQQSRGRGRGYGMDYTPD